MHTVWAILYSENVGTHTKTLNIKNTTLRTPKKAREIYFLYGSSKSGKWTEIDHTWERIPGMYDALEWFYSSRAVGTTLSEVHAVCPSSSYFDVLVNIVKQWVLCVLMNPVAPLAPREVFRLNRERYLKHSLAETIIHCIFVVAICMGEYSVVLSSHASSR